MKYSSEKIGFGGGCHWCTEAVFQSLKGVFEVQQGWISSDNENDSFSEAVIVHFDTSEIDLATLTAIHLYTHSCTSEHPMRKKYRSAIYTFSKSQEINAVEIMKALQSDFEKPVLTKILLFVKFKENQELYQNYYQKNAGNQFCERYINPKLNLLMKRFSKQVDKDKLA